MMHNKGRNAGGHTTTNNEDVVKSGYLKKLKTMKKKFFVLRRDSGVNHPARLEYYDSEKKFLAGIPPKKPIFLNTCFSINRKDDAKHSHVIALYTNNDSLTVAADSEAEMKEWLGILNRHMQSKKTYEHVWLVAVQPRSLGSSKGLTGEHRICLTCKSIALVRVGDCSKKIEFPLNSIRRCGHTGSFFFLGLGRSAVTGAGDIWMHTEDAVIAENMHSIIRKAMNDPCNRLEEDPVSRERTQSMSNNRPFDGGGGSCPRGRCGSMPSRSRTSSEGSVQNAPNKLHGPNCSHQLEGIGGGSLCLHVTRPQSMYSPSLSSSCSPPYPSALFSPSSSESMESNASVEELDGLPSGHHSDTTNATSTTTTTTTEGLCSVEEDSYMRMTGGSIESGSGFHHPHQHPPFSLPISSNRTMAASSLIKGLVSPGSGYGSEAQTLQSPQDNYLDMSPSERKQLGLAGLSLDQNYMCMDRQTSHTQSNSGAETSGYIPMAPLNSPGAVNPAWPSYPSSQVSSPPGSANHSRMSSLVDEHTDNYLSMVPKTHGGGEPSHSEISARDKTGAYINMAPTPALPTPIPYSPSEGDSFPEMSPGSSCSFTSGTPSSDHRFPDFIVEKSGSYCGCSEDDDSSSDRPIRTNSVGSKPEQYRSRKNSAPILGSSPISNSWSGTPGTFFRGFLQAQSQERNEDLMEFDFTKNKSYDSISAEKEKKSSSFESIKRTLTGQRHRSNSKSSGNGKSSVFDSIKRDKKKSESELSNKSIDLSERSRFRELDINPSPIRKISRDSQDGYLPMKPNMVSHSLNTDYVDVDMSSRESLNRHFPEWYLDITGGSERLAWPSTGTHEDYVDMGQGKGYGLHTIASISSSSVNSNCSSSASARVRKISSTINPMPSLDSSQLDEYMSVDLRSNAKSSHSQEGDKSRKKDKKSIKRKSFKESSKKKKSDPISVTGRSVDTEGGHEVTKKGTSPLQSLSTLWGRKNSTSTTPPKTPLSPTGSPLPKSNRGTPSPFSSLTRNKNREDRDRKDSVGKESVGGMTSSVSSGIGTSCIEESSREAEESAISGDSLGIITSSSQTVPNLTEPMNKQRDSTSGGSKRASGIFEAPPGDAKEDNNSQSAGQSVGGVDHLSPLPGNNDHGAYVNLAPASCEKSLTGDTRLRKLSYIPPSSDYMNISAVSSGSSKPVPGESEPQQSREYMNMCPGSLPEPAQATTTTSSSSPSQQQPPPPASSESLPSVKCESTAKSDQEKNTQDTETISASEMPNQKNVKSLSVNCALQTEGSKGESGYLLMTPGQRSPKPLSPKTVTPRPDIPASLLSDHSSPSLTATLERLNLSTPGTSSGERCRSHSGPGAPEGSAVSSEVRVKKQLSEPRGGSGSTGSSEKATSACSSPVSYSPPTSPTLGGSVSSVSSLSEGGLSSASSTCTVVNVGVARREGPSSGLSRTQDMIGDTTVHSTASAVPSQQSLSAVGSGSKDSGLNYVSLDLGPSKTVGTRSSPRTTRRAAGGTPAPSTATQEPAADDDEPLSYAQIDFTKSEGLRTTSLFRDHQH